MSSKITGFTVVFEDSVTEEYMDMVKYALTLYKKVSSVEPIEEGVATFIGRSQENTRIKNELIKMIQNDFK